MRVRISSNQGRPGERRRVEERSIGVHQGIWRGPPEDILPSAGTRNRRCTLLRYSPEAPAECRHIPVMFGPIA